MYYLIFVGKTYAVHAYLMIMIPKAYPAMLNIMTTFFLACIEGWLWLVRCSCHFKFELQKILYFQEVYRCSSVLSYVCSDQFPLATDRKHVIDLLPNLWALDGQLITGKRHTLCICLTSQSNPFGGFSFSLPLISPYMSVCVWDLCNCVHFVNWSVSSILLKYTW